MYLLIQEDRPFDDICDFLGRKPALKLFPAGFMLRISGGSCRDDEGCSY